MPRGTSVYDEARLQGRLWAPSMYAPGILANWHDPSDISGLKFSNASITADADRGPNGYTESATAGSSAPTYLPNAINGRTAISFNGSQQFTSCAMPGNPTNRTFIVVFSCNNPSNTNTLYGSSASGGLQFRISGNNLALINEAVANLGDSSSSSIKVAAKVPSIMVCSYRQSGALSFRLNGRLLSSQNAGTTLQATTSVVGYNPTTAGEAAVGLMGGRICLNSDLVADVQRAEGHLAWIWGIPLVGTHPYANRPPLIGD